MRTLAITLLSCISLFAQGQLYDAQWALGFNESIVDFRNNDSVNTYSLSTLQYFTTTNANICDEFGNLLYYTNGVDICNSQSILANGSL